MTVIIHYHEIALKGKNRGMFETALIARVRAVLGGEWNVVKVQGAIKVTGTEVTPEVIEKLPRIFGIAHFVVTEELPVKLSDGPEAVLAAVRDAIRSLFPNPQTLTPANSFAVDVKRSDKRFPMTSMEMEKTIGGFVFDIAHTKVDLKNPEMTIALELISDRVYLSLDSRLRGNDQDTKGGNSNPIPYPLNPNPSTGRYSGPGGLPTGTAGRVLTLISGGLDSPIAAWQLMRRGAISDFIHFHSYPQTDRRSIEKVRQTIEILTRWQGPSRIFLVPLLPIQQAVMMHCDRRYAILLYRRAMIRIAEAIATRVHAQALVTGDSLGQVASQTLDNITAVNAVAIMPIFRPLIGTDKEEIIQRARSIGTYDISIEPHEDCCTLFVPRNPVTHARISDLEREERKLNITTLIEQAVASVEDVRVDIKSQRL